MGYTFIDHTADVAADLTGRTVEELFASAAQAMTDTVTDLSSVRPVITQSVTVEAGAIEDLLVDWLNELLYRFEFPERPGALLRFLDSMRSDWNISLFHYRNQGADYGRVLVGMQVPSSDKRAFRTFLDRLGYDYVDETENPAYRMFLGR